MGWIISRRARWCAGGGREKRRRRVQVLRRKTFTGLTGRIGIAVGRAVAAISPKQGLFLCMHASTRNEQRLPEVGHREGPEGGTEGDEMGWMMGMSCLSQCSSSRKWTQNWPSYRILLALRRSRIRAARRKNKWGPDE